MKRKIIWIVIGIFSFSYAYGCAREDNQGMRRRASCYAALGQGYINRSIKLYEELIKRKPNSALVDEARLELGQLYLNTGRYAQAVQCLSLSQSPLLKEKLAQAYFKNAQYADALAQFQKLGEIKDPEALYYYAQALGKNNLYDKALEIYKKVPFISPYYKLSQARLDSINSSGGMLPQEQAGNILRDASGEKEHPQAGALVLLADEEFEVLEDNTARMNMHYRIKILNERGREDFSEVPIQYDSTFEEVQLEYARTIKPDGTVVNVGDKNTRDVSLYLNFPLYSNARVKIISMPEVCDGAIIEYKAHILRKQLINKKDFIINYQVQESEPIKEARFLLKVPSKVNTPYKILNTQYNKFGAELNPKVDSGAEIKSFSWALKNIPEIIPEPDMPPASRINPIIMISTFSSWDEIYRWWYELYKDKIKIDSQIEQKIKELIKGKASLLDKARAIYNFCAQDIRYVAVEYGQAGYEPHQAVDIFKNKYGDCKDQAILLVAMLRSQGVAAYPVLIPTYDNVDLQEDFPTLTFDHCIAVANIGDKWIFMDPTAQTVSFGELPPGDLGRKVLVVLDSAYKIMPIPIAKAEDNFSEITMQIKINPDETIYAKRKASTRGAPQYAQRYWLEFTKPELIKQALKARAQDMAAGAELLNYRIENVDNLDKQIVLEYEFKAPEFLAKAGNQRLLPRLSSIGISSVVKEKRNYPIEFPLLGESINSIEIELPEKFKIKYVPEPVKVESEWFNYEATYTLDKNKILFFEKEKLNKKLVTIEEYGRYKALREDTARKINQGVVLEQRGKEK